MKEFNYLWTGKGVPILGSQWLDLWWPMKFLTSAVAADLPSLGPVPVKVMVTSSPATSALNLAESPLLKFWLYVRVPFASPSIRDRKKWSYHVSTEKPYSLRTATDQCNSLSYFPINASVPFIKATTSLLASGLLASAGTDVLSLCFCDAINLLRTMRSWREWDREECEREMIEFKLIEVVL